MRTRDVGGQIRARECWRVWKARSGDIHASVLSTIPMPEVREEFIRVLRNGRMSLKTAWRSEEGMGSRGQVVVWLDVTILLTSSEVRGIKWVITEVGIGGGRMVAEVKEELMSFTFWVKKVTNSSAVREEGGGGEGG